MVNFLVACLSNFINQICLDQTQWKFGDLFIVFKTLLLEKMSSFQVVLMGQNSNFQSQNGLAI